MIITLENAKKINPAATQEYLDGVESAIRAKTNNKFHNLSVRFYSFSVTEGNKLVFDKALAFLRVDDTIEISNSYTNLTNGLKSEKGVNDGIFVIKEITDTSITLDTESLFEGTFTSAFITKVEYPADIKNGVMNLLKYDDSMSGKLGIKSESISRMSVTYYDMNSTETIEGYPASLMSFIKKYMKMRW